MDADDLHTHWHTLVWGVKRSQRYHAKRTQFFQRWAWACSMIAILSGSGAVLAGLQKAPAWVAVVSAVLIALFGGLNLVFRFAELARDHRDFNRKFADLEARMLLAEPSESELRKFQAERLKLEGEEPAVKPVLDVICHNEQLIADGAKIWPHQVTFAQRVLRNYLSEYKPVG